MSDEFVSLADERKRRKGKSAEITEDFLALRFAEKYADKLRFVAVWNQFLRWTGTVWQAETTLLPWDNARAIARDAAKSTPGNAAKIASAKTVYAIVTLARADRRIAATVDQWDADHWVLNTPGGIIDLRSGERTPCRPDAYLTKITAVAPDPACPIPLWTAFLETVTSGDRELIAFLKRMAGYGLTGDTREHALFFLYGTGGNGKGVFMNTITKCAGDYATSTPIETFTASNTDRHPTELADLRGARTVIATETEEGRRWAESRIKMLTGGDPVKARFMRQNFFEYQPQFKLIISGNHKPGLRSVDEAIRRRFNLVPFTVTIPPDERDPDLADKLRAEWPGILAWMIDGATEWLESGLAAPETVTAATAAYLESEDALSAWIDECCDRDPNAWEPTKALWASWSAWAERSREHAGVRKQFPDKLDQHGFTLQRRRPEGSTANPASGYWGLRIRPAEEEQPYWNRD